MRHLRVTGMVLFAMMLFFACIEKNQQADTKQNAKNLTPADALTEQIAKNPDNPDLYFQRAKWNLSMKKVSAAEIDIRKALSLDSSKAEYHLLQGDIHFAGFKIKDAETSFLNTISINPQSIDAYMRLSELYLYMKNYEESVRNANEVLRIDKRRVKAYFIKGFVYKETRDTLRAISNFQTCVEQDPNYYDAIMQLANLYSTHNDPIALQYYNNALRLQPHSIEALYGRGLFFQNTGEIEKALVDYNELLKYNPQHGFTYFNLGYIAMKHEKDYRKAIPLLSAALTHEKHYVEAYYNRGICY